VRPVSPDTGAPEVTLAEEQLEYAALVAAVYTWPDGDTFVLTRWRFSDEERERIANGEDLYLNTITHGKPFQPVRLTVGTEDWMLDAYPKPVR